VKEYVVWGIPEGEKDERLLFTVIPVGGKKVPITSLVHARMLVRKAELLGATGVRIQRLDPDDGSVPFDNVDKMVKPRKR